MFVGAKAGGFGFGWALALWALCSVALAALIDIKDPELRKAVYRAMAKGQLEAAAGRWQESAAAYREAVELAPDQVETHHGYQDSMERLGKRAEMVAQYRSKLKRQPQNALAYYLLGRVEADLGEKETLLKKALELDPKMYWASYALGHCYERQGRWEESEKAFKQALAVAGDWAEGYHALGFCYMEQGKDELAEAAYRKALGINPRYVDSMVNMSVLALRKGKAAEAAEWCGKALAIEPDNPEALNNLGKAYYEQGRPRAAEKEFKKALASKKVDNAEVKWLNLGFCYYQMRNWEAAAAAFSKAIELNPSFAYARYCLAQARLRQEKPDEAWKLVKEAQ
ncbi:MAG TPA: tetratricopeptide repeat protein [Candidatus Brocadiia bacterium]|nr:tetratricopeptide repeat protein [Candidatus Brocadiia bacterium]